MFNFTFMPDVGMGYVSLDLYTLFECFLAWPSLHPFTFLEMFLLSCFYIAWTHFSLTWGVFRFRIDNSFFVLLLNFAMYTLTVRTAGATLRGRDQQI